MGTTCAPRFLSIAQTVTDAPPVPSTRAFQPEISAFNVWVRSVSNPKASVLSPKIVPSGRLSRVLTLPMARAVSESSSQKGITVFL